MIGVFFTLVFISLSHQTHFYHYCDHDKIQRQTKVRTISFENSKSRNKRTLTNEREPIRIYLDFLIDKDEFQCVNDGQPITWQDTIFTCEAIDIPNETQKVALKKTMENVRDYLQSILLVDRLNTPIDITTSLEGYFNLADSPNPISDTDIYLSVFIRTYGDSQTLASAHYVTTDSETYRPIQGAIYVNSRYLPTEAQNENSTNTDFFYTVVHEIMHALGVSSDSFPYYHPKDSTTPYESPLVELNDEATGKKHTFLVTPFSHKFAVMQWGVENFTINGVTVPSGIEIEDGGGEGTAGSHPDCRIGNQDLMVGVSIQGENGPYSRFTPLTAAILLDTGNYDIVWTKIQPLVWGNKDSIDGNYIKDFVIGPPQNVFPQQYIYRPSTDPINDQCGFTFKMLGGLNKVNITLNPYYNCSLSEWKDYADTEAYCNAEKFYNPNGNDEIGGEWSYDFQMIHFPDEICAAGSACIPGIYNCAPYKIADDEKSFTITIDDVEYECNESNVNKMVYEMGDYIYENGIKCPPIEQFIRTVRMMEEQQYLTGDPFIEEVQVPSSSEYVESSIDAESSAISSEENQETASSDIDQTNASDDESYSSISSDEDQTQASSNEDQSNVSSNENQSNISSNEEHSSISSDEDQTQASSNEDQSNVSSGADQSNISSNEEHSSISSDEDQGTISSESELSSKSTEPDHAPSSPDDHTDVPVEIPLPAPSIDDSYQSSSSEIIFTENGFKDKEGNENAVTNEEDDILLIKSDQNELTVISGNSNKGNLFISPQNENSVITIKKQEGQTDFHGAIGLHANSKNPTVNLPQSSAPLNLFNNENSKISFVSDQITNSVPISLQKLTISDGTIHIDVPEGSTGVEFKEVETFMKSKIETYHNNALSDTSIGSLKMNQGSNIEVTSAIFSNSITCDAGSQMKIERKAKFNDKTVITLTDTSFINFGKSLIEGICKEIVVKQNGKLLDDEKSATIMCGSNFDCRAWKEKYSKDSSAYPYAKCTTEGQNGTCLVATNKNEETPKKKKGLSKGAIAGIVIACIAVVVIIIIVAVCVKKCNRRNYDHQYP
ncbi:hypothetical protein M9Y10_018463 [Tritrichomonas musculus]|uniref:GP63-like n=1 Tax=Tritrichomonas musculus TaxID=1915356 RepID=A0ABR2HMI7_9EUKA